MALNWWSPEWINCYRFGWKPGDGLGVDSKRQPNSSWVDIMDSCIKYMAHYGSGLGYHGEKLQRLGLRRQTSHSIRTMYAITSASINFFLQLEISFLLTPIKAQRCTIPPKLSYILAHHKTLSPNSIVYN